jgi:tripartite-type tricarboxylate transporter receptor subunit TctC
LSLEDRLSIDIPEVYVKLFAVSLMSTIALAVPQFAQAQPGPAEAAAFPSRPIRIVVPYTPGGVTDVLMRLIGAKMSENFRQPVVVENRPGGNATIGTAVVAEAPAGGYTLVAVSAAHTVNQVLFKKLPYETMNSFAPISMVGSTPLVIAVSPASGIKDIYELTTAVRQRPGELTYGAGTTAIHLMTQMYLAGVGGRALYVPYKGSTAPQMDVMAGTLSMLLDTPTALVANIRAGKLRGLAVTALQRSSVLPDLPTVHETVLRGLDVKSWQGLLAPRGTSPAVVAKLAAEVMRILKLPDVMQRMSALGIEPVGSSPEEFDAAMRAEILHWQKAAKEAGVEPE